MAVKVHRLPATAPVCLCALASLVFTAQAGAQPSPAWSRVVTPDLTIVTAMPREDAQRVSTSLMTFSAALRRLLPGARLDASAPTVVFAFNSFEAYEPFAPRYGSRVVPVAGSFIGSAQANYLALILDARPRAWSVAYHELSHLIVSQTLVRPPTWFNEGIAEYYSTFTSPVEGSIQLGGAIPEHVLLLRREPWVPLDDLLTVDTRSALYNESDRRSMFYAESWALVHFLLNGSADRRTELFDFLSRSADGQATLSAFRAAFGMAPSTMEEELRRHVERTDWRARTYEVGGASAARARVEPMSEAQAQAALAGLLLTIDRVDEAYGRALAAVNQDPACTAGWAMLTAATVRQHLLLEAVPLLRRAVDPSLASDPIAAYHAGTAAIDINEGAGEDVLSRRDASRLARTSLEQAVAAHPAYAEAWASLAHAWLLDGSNAPATVDAARRARSLAPLRYEYVLLEAQAYMQAGELTQARAAIEAALEKSIEPALGEKLMQVLERVTALEEAKSRIQKPEARSQKPFL